MQQISPEAKALIVDMAKQCEYRQTRAIQFVRADDLETAALWKEAAQHASAVAFQAAGVYA